MEQAKRVKIFMGIPTTGEIFDAQTYMLREIEAKYKDRVELVYPQRLVRRMFHDFARNAIVEEFLKTDCDVLWFLDSDIGPNREVLRLVTDHYDLWEVAGAPYAVFMTPPGEDKKLEGALQQVLWCVYKKSPKGSMVPCDIPFKGTEFVDGLATGCLFIKRSVFEKMKKPYFEFTYDPETRDLKSGEDIGFAKKCSELGIKFFVDYGLPCKHQKKLCLLEVNNYAIEYANKSVLAYDASIKAQIQEAVAAAYTKGKQDALRESQAAPQKKLILPGY